MQRIEYDAMHMLNGFVFLENIKPEVLKYTPNLQGLCIKTEGFMFFCTMTKLVRLVCVVLLNSF